MKERPEKAETRHNEEQLKNIVDDIELHFDGELDDAARRRIFEAIRNMEAQTDVLGHDFRLSMGKNDKGREEYVLTFFEKVKARGEDEEQQRTYHFAKEPPPMGTTSSGKKSKKAA